MVKLITLFSKKAGVSDEDFYKYWKEKHGPLALKVMTGVRKMVQNYPIKLPGFVYPSDGIVEAWFDDVDSYLKYYAWRQSDEGKVLLKDEETFIDKSKFIRFIVEEHEVLSARQLQPIKPGTKYPESDKTKEVKLLTLFSKRDSTSDLDFYRYWREKHGPLAIKVMAGVRKMVQNYPVKLPMFNYPADAVIESWFYDLDTFIKYDNWRKSSDAGSVLRNDESEFIDRSKFVRYCVKEYEIK